MKKLIIYSEFKAEHGKNMFKTSKKKWNKVKLEISTPTRMESYQVDILRN